MNKGTEYYAEAKEMLESNLKWIVINTILLKVVIEFNRIKETEYIKKAIALIKDFKIRLLVNERNRNRIANEFGQGYVAEYIKKEAKEKWIVINNKGIELYE